MIGIRFSVWGDEVIERDLLRFQERAVDMRPAFLAMIGDMRDALTEQFDTEGGHASGGWEPLKESTVLSKAAAGLDSRILHATLALRNSITEGEDSQVLLQGESMTLDLSDVYYGGFHQRGTKNMPPRKPIAFTEANKVGFMRTLQRYMVEGEIGVAGAV